MPSPAHGASPSRSEPSICSGARGETASSRCNVAQDWGSEGRGAKAVGAASIGVARMLGKR
eukprot:5794007-Prymnesium_polylepis.1